MKNMKMKPSDIQFTTPDMLRELLDAHETTANLDGVVTLTKLQKHLVSATAIWEQVEFQAHRRPLKITFDFLAVATECSTTVVLQCLVAAMMRMAKTYVGYGEDEGPHSHDELAKRSIVHYVYTFTWRDDDEGLMSMD